MSLSPPRTERLTFPGHDGGERAGRLELPYAGEPRAVAIFAHCFSCGKDSRAATISQEATGTLAVRTIDLSALLRRTMRWDTLNYLK